MFSVSICLINNSLRKKRFLVKKKKKKKKTKYVEKRETNFFKILFFFCREKLSLKIYQARLSLVNYSIEKNNWSKKQFLVTKVEKT